MANCHVQSIMSTASLLSGAHIRSHSLRKTFVDALHLEALATLRIVVGYLGEREQFGWWPSAFFASGSAAFLAPLFARTKLLAQCTGVSQAAALVHDERIGTGQVYHLFRLPEEMEQGIHQALQNPALGARITALIESKGVALAHLNQTANAQHDAGIGPTLIGRASDLRIPEVLGVIASHYHSGFATGAPTFPYFSGGST
jgi:hypothetical protein